VHIAQAEVTIGTFSVVFSWHATEANEESFA
jgi:hypothetical protein